MNIPETLKHEVRRASETRPSDSGKILIVGGYGQVGRSIAATLAPLFPDRVVVAGRSTDRAMIAAAEIGHGAIGRMTDIFDGDSADGLDDVALAVVCVDQSDTRFVERCLARGILYLDISADYAFLSRVERLDGLARESGGTALLSVGVAPGLTNLLAARACEEMERVDRIDILLEVGLGDHHGLAAVEWMFDNLDATYRIREDGRAKRVRSFGEKLDLRLPNQRSDRPAYRFNFSDQHVIWRTLDVPTVSTWVRFEDRLSTWAFAMASQAGLGRLLQRRWWRKIAVWLFMNVRLGSNTCGVATRATGRTEDGEETRTLGVVGREEALMTAIIAAETTRQVLTMQIAPGVFHIEQAIALDPILAALDREMPGIVVSV